MSKKSLDEPYKFLNSLGTSLASAEDLICSAKMTITPYIQFSNSLKYVAINQLSKIKHKPDQNLVQVNQQQTSKLIDHGTKIVKSIIFETEYELKLIRHCFNKLNEKLGISKSVNHFWLIAINELSNFFQNNVEDSTMIRSILFEGNLQTISLNLCERIKQKLFKMEKMLITEMNEITNKIFKTDSVENQKNCAEKCFEKNQSEKMKDKKTLNKIKDKNHFEKKDKFLNDPFILSQKEKTSCQKITNFKNLPEHLPESSMTKLNTANIINKISYKQSCIDKQTETIDDKKTTVVSHQKIQKNSTLIQKNAFLKIIDPPLTNRFDGNKQKQETKQSNLKNGKVFGSEECFRNIKTQYINKNGLIYTEISDCLKSETKQLNPTQTEKNKFALNQNSKLKSTQNYNPFLSSDGSKDQVEVQTKQVKYTTDYPSDCAFENNPRLESSIESFPFIFENRKFQQKRNLTNASENTQYLRNQTLISPNKFQSNAKPQTPTKDNLTQILSNNKLINSEMNRDRILSNNKNIQIAYNSKTQIPQNKQKNENLFVKRNLFNQNRDDIHKNSPSEQFSKNEVEINQSKLEQNGFEFQTKNKPKKCPNNKENNQYSNFKKDEKKNENKAEQKIESRYPKTLTSKRTEFKKEKESTKNELEMELIHNGLTNQIENKTDDKHHEKKHSNRIFGNFQTNENKLKTNELKKIENSNSEIQEFVNFEFLKSSNYLELLNLNTNNEKTSIHQNNTNPEVFLNIKKTKLENSRNKKNDQMSSQIKLKKSEDYHFCDSNVIELISPQKINRKKIIYVESIEISSLNPSKRNSKEQNCVKPIESSEVFQIRLDLNDKKFLDSETDLLNRSKNEMNYFFQPPFITLDLLDKFDAYTLVEEKGLKAKRLENQTTQTIETRKSKGDKFKKMI